MATKNVYQDIDGLDGLRELVNKLTGLKERGDEVERNTLVDLLVDLPTKTAVLIIESNWNRFGSEGSDSGISIEVYAYRPPYFTRVTEYIAFGKKMYHPEKNFKEIKGLSIEDDKMKVKVAAEGFAEIVYELMMPQTTTLSRFMDICKIRSPITEEDDIYPNPVVLSRYLGFMDGYENGKKRHENLRSFHQIIELYYNEGFKQGFGVREMGK